MDGGIPHPLLELRHYRYFRVLAEELHFARAAEKLGISQPALSQQVRHIEAILGAVLLVRGRRKVELTPVGVVLFEQACKVMEQVQRANFEVAEVASGKTGKVHIGYVASAALSGVLPRIVYDYRQQRPNVQVLLREMDMLKQLHALHEGELDIAFIRPPVPDIPEGVSMLQILEEPMCVVLHKDHPRAREAAVDIKELVNDTFICTHRSPGVGFYAITLAICAQGGFVPRTEVFSSQASILISMVAAGFGVALVPVSTEAFAPSDVVFKRLLGTTVRSSLSMASSSRSRSPAVRAFVQACRQWSDRLQSQTT